MPVELVNQSRKSSVVDDVKEKSPEPPAQVEMSQEPVEESMEELPPPEPVFDICLEDEQLEELAEREDA